MESDLETEVLQIQVVKGVSNYSFKAVVWVTFTPVLPSLFYENKATDVSVPFPHLKSGFCWR